MRASLSLLLNPAVVPSGSMQNIPPTNYLQAVKQELYKKAYFLTNSIEDSSEKKSEEWAINNNQKKKARKKINKNS